MMAYHADLAVPLVDADQGTGPAEPITSRFLFVDVAAQRAKQLRRGALPRLERPATPAPPHKLERIAMEEVRTGLIQYTLPRNYEGAGFRGGNKA